MKKYLALAILGTALLIPLSAQAQMDEIIVTGSRINNTVEFDEDSTPGLFLEKRGDFLLLTVRIENDSRELTTRLKEINAAVQDFMAAAETNPDIKLSIIDDNDFVRPLTQQNFRDGIRGGARPDTSLATLKVKTAIPDKVEDSYKLATLLSEFVDGIEERDRTKIQTYNDISVSVVNPYQYREELIKLVISEVNNITDSLGPEYRAVITGLDKDLRWVRSGDLNLAFYLPYSYNIIPDTLHSYR